MRWSIEHEITSGGGTEKTWTMSQSVCASASCVLHMPRPNNHMYAHMGEVMMPENQDELERDIQSAEQEFLAEALTYD